MKFAVIFIAFQALCSAHDLSNRTQYSEPICTRFHAIAQLKVSSNTECAIKCLSSNDGSFIVQILRDNLFCVCNSQLISAADLEKNNLNCSSFCSKDDKVCSDTPGPIQESISPSQLLLSVLYNRGNFQPIQSPVFSTDVNEDQVTMTGMIDARPTGVANVPKSKGNAGNVVNNAASRSTPEESTRNIIIGVALLAGVIMISALVGILLVKRKRRERKQELLSKLEERNSIGPAVFPNDDDNSITSSNNIRDSNNVKIERDEEFRWSALPLEDVSSDGHDILQRTKIFNSLKRLRSK